MSIAVEESHAPGYAMIGRLVRGLYANVAETKADSADFRLRGRTYGIPFDTVWNAALLVAEEDMKRWDVVSWEDRTGLIVIEAQRPLLKWTDDVRVHVSLDEDAQTRIDVTSMSRKGNADLGSNARRIGRFFKFLDHRLGLTTGRKRPSDTDSVTAA